MSVKKKFLISGILMLVIPVVLVLVLSAVFLFHFSLKYPWLQPPDRLNQFWEDAELLRAFILWVVLSIVIAVTTSTVITLSLSRSILKPLEKLREAARNIRDGNLDFEVTGSDIEEIQALCGAFDEMRLRLKESVAMERVYEAERSQLMASIAHDLKTPLTSIIGYVEGIQDGVANTPEKRERYFATILAKARGMGEILENLFLYSKLDLGKVHYHFEHLDPCVILRETLNTYALDFQEAGMECVTELLREPVMVKADRENLKRVFSNLISNAVKYRNREVHSRLTVSAEQNERGIFLSFADNGIGIASADITKVFEVFYRSDPSRNSRIKGSGLGLVITKQIVEDHGGKIWLRSEENAGTQVTIYLPFIRQEEKT